MLAVMKKSQSTGVPPSSVRSRSGMAKGALLAIVLAGLLAFAVGIALYMWRRIGAVDIGTDGVIALVLGVGVSLALGIGLMRLVYFSSRRGYDDNVD
jgi:Flp pilus assembly protein protease CpaA